MSTSRLTGFLVSVATLFAVLGTAQAQTPEHARLKLFEGFWVYTGTLDGAQFGLTGPNTHSESCAMIGTYFVRCQYEVNAPSGAYNGVGIVGYDVAQRHFTFTSYDSRGVITTLRAAVESGKWVWAAGASNRVAWEQLTPTAYAFRVEALQPSGQWRVVDSGRYDKIRAR